MKSKPKKIIVNIFYADSCYWCNIMEDETYSNRNVEKVINHNFYAVRFNAGSKKVIPFKGQSFNMKAGNRYHDLAIMLLNGNLSFPNTVFLDENMEIISTIPGFYKPVDFTSILQYINTNAYKTQKWEDYTKKKPPYHLSRYDKVHISNSMGQ